MMLIWSIKEVFHWVGEFALIFLVLNVNWLLEDVAQDLTKTHHCFIFHYVLVNLWIRWGRRVRLCPHFVVLRRSCFKVLRVAAGCHPSGDISFIQSKEGVQIALVSLSTTTSLLSQSCLIWSFILLFIIILTKMRRWTRRLSRGKNTWMHCSLKITLFDLELTSHELVINRLHDL